MSVLERSRPLELPLDNFGVDFNCDTNILFARLTEKPGRTVCRLSSNWKDVFDTEDYDSFRSGRTYDIFADIKMYLISSLKIMSFPGIRDRNSRIIKAQAELDCNDLKQDMVKEVIQEGTRLGNGWSFTRYSDQRQTCVKLEYPFQGVLDLEGRQTVQSILQNMSSAIEHTIRVCYAVKGKNLPEKRLIFFPHVEPGEAKEVPAFVTCSYCGSNRPGSGVKCPSCGAPARRPL